MAWVVTLFVAAALVLPKRPVQFTDIPTGLRSLIGASSAGEFDTLRARIENHTRERLQAGEDEHLVYFVLQSGSFTERPRAEPALSARQFMAKHETPAGVRARMEDFLAALRRPTADERLSYWKSHLPPDRRSVPGLTQAYTQSMRFLYEKEFRAVPGEVALLYQSRGHSTDSDAEVNYTVWAALAVIRALDPGVRLERVLIVGPGLDFAPRTGFMDATPPTSHQPYMTADSLLRWGLAAPEKLSIHCVDINPHVVDFIEGFPQRTARTLLLRRGPGDNEYQEFLEQAGRRIGSVTDPPKGRKIEVRKDVAAQVRAERLNILTERYDPSPDFDLVIATNVLLYFGQPELALALANIHSMMRPGGYFIHNELRPLAEAISKALNLPPVQARTLQVVQGRKQPLVDAFAIHRKN